MSNWYTLQDWCAFTQ